MSVAAPVVLSVPVPMFPVLVMPFVVVAPVTPSVPVMLALPPTLRFVVAPRVNEPLAMVVALPPVPTTMPVALTPVLLQFELLLTCTCPRLLVQITSLAVVAPVKLTWARALCGTNNIAATTATNNNRGASDGKTATG